MSNWFYTQWAKIGLWTTGEAAMLSLYTDPYNLQDKVTEEGDDVIKEIEMLDRRIQRAIETKHLKAQGKDKVLAADFVKWAQKENLELPEELIAAINENPDTTSEKEAELKKLGTKEEHSLLKIISGMAFTSFKIQRGASPKAVKEVAKAIQEARVGLTAESAEKWLNIAIGNFPPKSI